MAERDRQQDPLERSLAVAPVSVIRFVQYGGPTYTAFRRRSVANE
ncbi:MULTISPECIES: hypothetical protein [Streptomyces]|nr:MULTISPECIES: hypothetical protein [Streptomyces]